MSKINAGQAPSTLIPEYIGSAFDKVVTVADNIDDVITVSKHIDDVEIIADNIGYVQEVAEDLHGMPITMFSGETPPVLNPMPEGLMWYCTTDGRTYVWYVDVDSGQWVESAPQSGLQPADGQFSQVGAGAVTRVPQDKMRDIVSSKDYVSFQAAVDSPTANGQSLSLPTGDYLQQAPIKSGAKGLRYAGTGPNSTRLLCNTDISIIEHGLGAGQPKYVAPLTLRDLSLYAVNGKTTKPAIKAKFDHSSGGFLLDNVDFGSFSGDYGFGSFVEATGASRTTFRTIRANGTVFGTPAQRANGPQVGFHFLSQNNTDKSYEYVFDDIFISAEKHGFLFECFGPVGNSGSLEGITMINVRGRTNIGPWIKFDTPNDGNAWKPPLFTMGAGCNYEGCGAIAHFEGIEAFIMTGNWHAQSAALPGSTSLDLIRLREARKVVIENNTFRIYDAAQLEWVIAILSGCNDVVIQNNTFIYEGKPVVAGGGIFVDASVPNLVCKDNVFINWPSGLPKARYSNGKDIPLGDDVTISGSYTSVTTASGKLIVTFPTRPDGTAYFKEPPVVTGICNGDPVNGGNNFFNLLHNTVTTLGFEVVVVDSSNTPVIGAPRRVNWTAVGK